MFNRSAAIRIMDMYVRNPRLNPKARVFSKFHRRVGNDNAKTMYIESIQKPNNCKT